MVYEEQVRELLMMQPTDLSLAFPEGFPYSYWAVCADLLS